MTSIAAQPVETVTAAPRRASALPAALALAGREWLRFLRQRNRVIGALLTPVLFWLLLGFGMGDSFKAPGSGEPFLSYFFPGTLVMVLLFTAIFATITLIEDRREGFMQGVLVAPVPRSAVVLGKLLGGASLAWAQAVLLLLLAPLAGGDFSVVGYLVAAGFLALLSVGLVGLGLCLAWPMTSTQGYHVAMNLLLMPLWLFSGSVFPVGASGAGPVRWLMYADPITYGLAGVRQGLHWDQTYPGLPPLWVSALAGVAFCAAMFALAAFVAERPVRADVES